MKKKLLIITGILSLVAFAGTVYLNTVLLPVKFKAVIVKTLEDATGKKVSLQAFRFNIFKGFVLKDLALYEGKETIFSFKECSFGFLILPVLKNKIIIPSICVRSPKIFVERRADGSFNTQGLFLKKSALDKKRKFAFFIYKLKVTGGTVNFKDGSVKPSFSRDFRNLNLNLNLVLPAKADFKFDCSGVDEIIQTTASIEASGQYDISGQKLSAKVRIGDLSASGFQSYLHKYGFFISKGRIDILSDLNFDIRSKSIGAFLNIQSADLVFLKDKLTVLLNSHTRANLKYNFNDERFEFSGNSDILDSSVSGLGILRDVAGINGEVNFNNSGLSCDKLKADVLNIPFDIKVNLADFSAPKVSLLLSSKDAVLESNFAVSSSLLTIFKINGKYFNSDFSAAGDIDFRNTSESDTDIWIKLNAELKDVNALLNSFYPEYKLLEKINPGGIVHIDSALKGNIYDIRTCNINSKLASRAISFFGLKAGDFVLDCIQNDGNLDVRFLHLSFYDGSIEGSAKFNLYAQNMPYWGSFNIRGVNLEKLKSDTQARNKDISGTFNAQTRFNGFLSDFSKLGAEGNILITNAKLWQMDFFHRLGELIFLGDFAGVGFSEATCSFIVRDSYILTNDVKLKSSLSNIAGTAKMGFDNSIEASLNLEIASNMPLAKNITDVTLSIIGQIGRISVVDVRGSLKEPKFKFKPVVIDIFKGLFGK